MLDNASTGLVAVPWSLIGTLNGPVSVELLRGLVSIGYGTGDCSTRMPNESLVSINQANVTRTIASNKQSL
jgi:hypothetical protein